MPRRLGDPRPAARPAPTLTRAPAAITRGAGRRRESGRPAGQHTQAWREDLPDVRIRFDLRAGQPDLGRFPRARWLAASRAAALVLGYATLADRTVQEAAGLLAAALADAA